MRTIAVVLDGYTVASGSSLHGCRGSDIIEAAIVPSLSSFIEKMPLAHIFRRHKNNLIFHDFSRAMPVYDWLPLDYDSDTSTSDYFSVPDMITLGGAMRSGKTLSDSSPQ